LVSGSWKLEIESGLFWELVRDWEVDVVLWLVVVCNGSISFNFLIVFGTDKLVVVEFDCWLGLMASLEEEGGDGVE
jgi:hypothetical protein